MQNLVVHYYIKFAKMVLFFYKNHSPYFCFAFKSWIGIGRKSRIQTEQFFRTNW